MTLRAQEDAARRKMIQQASRAALRAHFSGDGAGARRWLFLREALLHSAGWTGALLCVASWAVVAGLLFGPNHADILLQVYVAGGNAFRRSPGAIERSIHLCCLELCSIRSYAGLRTEIARSGETCPRGC